jgi:CubicO group peptidase (beta-lactamase class C family)
MTACGPTVDERLPTREARARAYLDALIAAGRTPGFQYLALDSTRILLEYDGGSADLGHPMPMDGPTTMMAYSMSKTITAAAVLQLVATHKLGLDDPLARYVDSLPYPSAITLRQLLSHTSGIPNPIPLRWVHLARTHDSFDEHAALAAVVKQHPRLAFPPGTKYGYSNIGYWLLGSVVERASGEPFPAYVAAHILRPLGVTPQELGYTIPDSAHHATGYLEKYSFMNLMKRWVIAPEFIGEYDGPWLRIERHYPNGAAFGGLVGTARGFGKFLQDQLRLHSQLFDDATRGLFYAAQATGEGKPVAMTLGWHIGELDGQRFYYKEGGGGGFHSMMRLYPASGVATVVIANATGFNAKRCLDAVDRQFLQ